MPRLVGQIFSSSSLDFHLPFSSSSLFPSCMVHALLCSLRFIFVFSIPLHFHHLLSAHVSSHLVSPLFSSHLLYSSCNFQHLFIFTESENGRGWKGPLWTIWSNPLPKQGHPEQAALDHVQAGLEYLQRRRLHSLPGQPGPGLHHPQREEVLPHVQLELPLLPFVPVAPCPVAGHH